MIPCMGLPAFDLCSQLTISEIIESLIAEYSRSGMDLNELLNQWPASSFGATGFSPRFKCGKKFKEASEDDFVIKVDCRHFEASELSLTLSDGNIVVVGKHDEKAEGNGFVKREFTRRYPIPGEVEIEELSSSLSDCGVLTIKAPKKRSSSKGKQIPIEVINDQRGGGKDDENEKSGAAKNGGDGGEANYDGKEQD